MSTAAILPPPASPAGVLAAVARVEAEVRGLRAALAADPGLVSLTDVEAADAAVALAHAAESVRAGAWPVWVGSRTRACRPRPGM